MRFAYWALQDGDPVVAALGVQVMKRMAQRSVVDGRALIAAVDAQAIRSQDNDQFFWVISAAIVRGLFEDEEWAHQDMVDVMSLRSSTQDKGREIVERMEASGQVPRDALQFVEEQLKSKRFGDRAFATRVLIEVARHSTKHRNWAEECLRRAYRASKSREKEFWSVTFSAVRNDPSAELP
jgi:hypothetical protein